MSDDAGDEGDATAGADAGEVYVAVRRGVYDAVWDVIGSLAITVFSFILVAIGLAVASAGVQNDGSQAVLTIVFGVVIAVVGVLQFLHEFDVWPFR